MNKSGLLSIGEFSKISGVSIKSLRYYDRMGVLPPAYINEENHYRYYRLNQIYILECIMFCIDIGIPLRELRNYLSADRNTIHYERLFSDGKALADKKIAQIKQKLMVLEYTQNHMSRSSSLSSQPREIYIESETYILFPFENTESDIFSLSTVKDKLLSLTEQGIPIVHDIGVIGFYNNGQLTKHFFVPVEPWFNTEIPNNNVFVSPAGNFTCVKAKKNDIDNAQRIFNFPEYTSAIIIEIESFSSTYNINSPEHELRCIITSDSSL